VATPLATREIAPRRACSRLGRVRMPDKTSARSLDSHGCSRRSIRAPWGSASFSSSRCPLRPGGLFRTSRSFVDRTRDERRCSPASTRGPADTAPSGGSKARFLRAFGSPGPSPAPGVTAGRMVAPGRDDRSLVRRGSLHSRRSTSPGVPGSLGLARSACPGRSRSRRASLSPATAGEECPARSLRWGRAGLTACGRTRCGGARPSLRASRRGPAWPTPRGGVEPRCDTLDTGSFPHRGLSSRASSRGAALGRYRQAQRPSLGRSCPGRLQPRRGSLAIGITRHVIAIPDRGVA
jgi:hypothetical protein